MKKIYLIITLLLIVVPSFGQTTLSTSRCKYLPTYDEIEKIKIGDYEFMRIFDPIAYVEKRCYGKIHYTYNYDEKEYGAFEEINALKSHIERNKEYYEEKYKCEIEEVFLWKIYGMPCLMIVVIYPDWEEEHNRQQKELANTKNLEREKRLESINW